METHRSIVIVPSRTIDKFHEPAAETQAYEERLLCLLLMLRDPELRVVYVTSSPVAEPIVDYYLSLLARERAEDARERLTMLSADDASVAPAVGQAARAPGAAGPDPLGDRRPRALPPGPLRLRPSSSRRSATRSASPSMAPTPRWPTSAPRAARASCSPAPACAPARRRAHHRPADASRRSRACAPRAAGCAGRRQARRRRLRRGQRDRRAPRPAAPRRPTRRADRRALRRDGASRPPASPRSLPRAAARRRDRRGAHRRRASCAARASSSSSAAATRGSSPRTTRSSPASATSAAASRPSRLRARDHRERAPDRRATPRGGARGRAGIDFVVARDAPAAGSAYAIEVNLRSGGTTHPLAALELLSGGAYDADAATFTTPVRRRAPLRRDRPPRVAAAARARPRRAAALAALPRLAADGCGVASTCSARSTSSAASA